MILSAWLMLWNLTKIKGDFRLRMWFSAIKVWSFILWFTESLTALRKPISDLSWPDTHRNNNRSKLAAQCVTEHARSILERSLFEKSTMIIPAWPFWCDSAKKSAKSSRRAGQRCWLAELWRTWGGKTKDKMCCNSTKFIMEIISSKCDFAINQTSSCCSRNSNSYHPMVQTSCLMEARMITAIMGFCGSWDVIGLFYLTVEH